LSFCFPYAAYELRHSLDLALLNKWPVFLQNAFGNPTHVNQTNLNEKLRKNWGGQTGVKQKFGGAMAHPGPPLESPLLVCLFPVLATDKFVVLTVPRLGQNNGRLRKNNLLESLCERIHFQTHKFSGIFFFHR